MDFVSFSPIFLITIIGLGIQLLFFYCFVFFLQLRGNYSERERRRKIGKEMGQEEGKEDRDREREREMKDGSVEGNIKD